MILIFKVPHLDLTAKLCYVADGTAYFTTALLADQWGDDWNDAPYNHNAGLPYDDPGWHIYELKYESVDLQTPERIYAERGIYNCPFSVEDINRGRIPWLQTPDWYKTKKATIMAGETIGEFVEKVIASGGKVYFPVEVEGA